MVLRASEALQIDTGTHVDQVQSGAGYKNPDGEKYANSHTLSAGYEGESNTDRLLNNILGRADQLAHQYWNQSTMEAYLDGVAKSGTVQNEQELDGNPMTKAWQTAGYRDTVGRIAQADYEASVAADMPEMRKKSPQEFQQYIAEKRGKLMDSVQGMSLQGRENMFTSIMMGERAFIKKHGAEHTKYIWEQENESLKVGFNAAVRMMDDAKSVLPVYESATDNAFNYLYTSVMRNSKLPDAMKQKFITEAATHALESDNQMLYKKITSTGVQFSDGSVRPMIDAVGFDDSVKLAKQYRESMHRTEGIRSAKWADDAAYMQADWSNPDTPLMPVDQVRSFVQKAVEDGFIKTPEAQKAFMEEYYKASAKKLDQSKLANAYQTGDAGEIFAMGKTSEEGLDAWLNVYGKRMPVAQAGAKLLQIGNATGQGNAFKKLGTLLTPAFAQLGSSDVVDPNNAALVGTYMKALENSEKAGRDGAFQQFLSAMPEGVQDRVLYIREGMRQGMSPAAAISQANAMMTDASKVQVTPEVRAVLDKENRDIVEGLTERSIMSTAWMKTKAIVGSMVGVHTEDTSGITVRKQWFENQDRVNEAMAPSRLAFAEELQMITRINPMMSVESRTSKALAAVSARTIMLDSGPVVVPRGTSVQQFFGVSDEVGPERIASAMQEQVKPTVPDGRITFRVSEGRIGFKEWNSDGAMAREGTIDPKQVGPMVQKQYDDIAARYRANHGEGVEVPVKDGDTTHKLQFNGDNTAGAENSWVLRLRKRLVEHEGVKDVPYDDLSGKVVDGQRVKTVGVGVSSHNKFYPKVGEDGKVSIQDINASFIRASNQAAQGAMSVMDRMHQGSEKAFQFYSELAYQSGPAFASLRKYAPMMSAIQAGDKEAALAALKKTPAYSWTAEGSKRRKFYESALLDMMNQKG